MVGPIYKRAQRTTAPAAPPTQFVASGLKPEVRLYPHQREAIQRLLQNRGRLVMAAGVGTGKTGSSIAGVEVLRDLNQANRALVIVPAALRNNFAKQGVEKFTRRTYQVVGSRDEKGTVYPPDVTPDKDYTIVSYEMFLRDPVGLVQRAGVDTLIIDEFQRSRDPGGKTYKALMGVRPAFRNVIGLTGSIVSNDPVDVVPLVNVVAGQEYISPEGFKSRFERRYARAKGFFGGDKYLTTMRRLPEVENLLGPIIDYIGTEELAAKDMPRREIKEVNVEMSSHQKDLYEFALGRVGPIAAWKIRNNMPLSQKEAASVFTKIILARRTANDISTLDRNVSLDQSAEQTPKVRKLLDDATEHLGKTPDGRVVMYSNLVRGGVDVLAAGLRKRGVPFGVFVGKGREVGGEVSTGEGRQKAVEDFNAGKSKVLVLSGAGAEGLSLPNATLFQSLDGHFNPERILQAEARARRIGGQVHRPPEQRVVKIHRYRSTLAGPSFWGRLFGAKKETGVDEWVYNVAGQKAGLNRMFRSALRAARIKRQPTLPPLPTLPPESSTIHTPSGMEVALPGHVGPTRLTKYLRRWKDQQGHWRYEYAKGPVSP